MHPLLVRVRDAIRPFVKVHREGPPPGEDEIVQTVTSGRETVELLEVYNALEGATDGASDPDAAAAT